MARSHRGALRRYPALGFLGVAAALALALPSALIVPNTGPPTLAEFAPVPGDGGDGTGDLGRLGSGSGDGLGGSGTGTGGAGLPPAQDPGRPPSTVKQCVGKPPRQTEDPLSPPCVAFFEGDNFGATSRGVTRDEITVVVHLGATSSQTQPFVIDYDDPDQRDPGSSANLPIDDVIRAYSRHFNERYQTYGRHVHFWGYRGTSTTPEGLRAQVGDMIDRLDPFAILSLSTSGGVIIAKEAAARGVLAPNFTGLDRALQRKRAPFLPSYSPDLQDEARIAGTFLCRKLTGRAARFSGDPAAMGARRRFGIVYQDSVEQPEWKRLKELFVDEIARCGIDGVPEESVKAESNTTQNQGATYALNIASLRSEDVTTVITFGGNASTLFWQNAAAGQGWSPEWFLPGTFLPTGPDTNFVARQYNPAAWSHAFGITYDYRRPARTQQFWFRAYREGCPSCATPAASPDIVRLYDLLVELFWGIQAAGPRLTAETIDRGLHAIPPRSSPSPTVPATYFAPGNYSWIKDAMAIWWDGQGREPGSGTIGCYRLSRAGWRFRADEWRAGDGDLFAAGAPCQGPER